MDEATPDLVLSFTGQSESSQNDTGRNANNNEAHDNNDDPENLEDVHAIVVECAKKPDNDYDRKDHASTPRRNHPMSTKIQERAEWLSGLFDTDSPSYSNSKNKSSPDSTKQQRETAKLAFAKKRKSKLVAQRLEWIMQQMSPNNTPKGDQSKSEISSIPIPEGVTLDLSKRWQAFVEAHVTAGRSWEQLELRQQWRTTSGRSHIQDGDSQPPPTTCTAYYESPKTATTGDKSSNEKQQLGAAASVTDKAVWFLEQMSESESMIRAEQQALLVDFMQQEGKREIATAGPEIDSTHYLLGDDDNGEQDLSFLGRALIGLEQEGVLPGFLADWLGGAASTNKGVNGTTGGIQSPNDASFKQPLDILRLDYQAEPQQENGPSLTVNTERLLSASEAPAIPVAVPIATLAPKLSTAISTTTTTTTTTTTVIATPTAPTERIEDESTMLDTTETTNQSSVRSGLLHRTRAFFVNPESYQESICPNGGRRHQQQQWSMDSKSSTRYNKMSESLTFNDHAIFLEDGGLLMSMPWSEL